MVVSMSSDRRVGHGLQGQVVVGREARIVASEATALKSSDLPDDGGNQFDFGATQFCSNGPGRKNHLCGKSKFVK